MINNRIIIDRRHEHPSPRLSIVIVTYNAQETLAATLKSIAQLELEAIELVIIDGASKDGTLEIVKHFGNVVTLCISEPDNGIYHAMNKGVSLARGRYVYFLGADDILLANFRMMLSKLNEDYSVLYSNVRLLSNGRTYLGEFNKYKLMQSNICHQSIFYSRDVLLTNPFDEKYKYLADYVLNIKLFSTVDFVYYPFVICEYNDFGASSSGDILFEKNRTRLIHSSFGFFYMSVKLIRNFFAKRIKS
jgi:glycosyltransferase involved in cell wall biosynthesis